MSIATSFYHDVYFSGNPSHDNKIFNNTFDGGSIYFYSDPNDEKYNFFCINGIGNTYLNGITGPTCPTTTTTTTTIPSGDLEGRVSALEDIIGQIKQFLCSLHFFNADFCKPKCPSGYSCTATCVDDMVKPYCYNRTVHSEYFCSYDKVCCESKRMTCPS
jgi:hypothetical protein